MVGKLQSLKSELFFVPKHVPPTQFDIEALQRFVQKSCRLFVLTGAGISTESGIPDYRSDKVGLYARTNHRPVLHSEFLKSDVVRQRYWARNYVGWERFSRCEPNYTHRWLKDSRASVVVTQNVDGLHSKAGSENVVELHGTSFRVVCLNCGSRYERRDVQNAIRELNPNMDESTTMVRPDGDVEIAEDAVKCFRAPSCGNCGGVLKPDIVFFGDNVPQDRAKEVQNHVSASDAVLVLGSSLYVYSGFRIILQAIDEGKSVAIVNIGPTRGDKYANVKIAAKCGDVLRRINIDC